MDNNIYDVYDLVETAIDNSFQGNLNLRFYDYLKQRKTKKIEVDEFIKSLAAEEISNLVIDLNEYLKGGSDGEHKQLREGYGYIPKPQARKIISYLSTILEDAVRYSNDKKPGRRRKAKKK